MANTTTTIPYGYWSNGIPMTDQELSIVSDLRVNGCKCELPLIGYKDGKPRCRICNTKGGMEVAND